MPWRTWFDTATGKRNRSASATVAGDDFAPLILGDHSSPPNAAMLAHGLRMYAKAGGQCPPDFLEAVADLFDPPPAYKGATAKIMRPRGGKTGALDMWAIGQRFDELAPAGFEAALIQVRKEAGCSETTAKQALSDYRASMAAHAEATREA